MAEDSREWLQERVFVVEILEQLLKHVFHHRVSNNFIKASAKILESAGN